MSLELTTMHTAARIDADRQPSRLERVRQRREAMPAAPQRPVLVRQLGLWLSQAGTWLQGLPPVVLPDLPPAIAPEPVSG